MEPVTGVRLSALKAILPSVITSTANKKLTTGRSDRVVTEDEIVFLLASCKQSKSPYLYCIVLISLTTGARQGEILISRQHIMIRCFIVLFLQQIYL